jgi:hypothetical protein
MIMKIIYTSPYYLLHSFEIALLKNSRFKNEIKSIV